MFLYIFLFPGIARKRIAIGIFFKENFFFIFSQFRMHANNWNNLMFHYIVLFPRITGIISGYFFALFSQICHFVLSPPKCVIENQFFFKGKKTSSQQVLLISSNSSCNSWQKISPLFVSFRFVFFLEGKIKVIHFDENLLREIN